ncbi:MAG: hypothetical protein RLZ65_808 [Actinomycetota bacterium]|jgi:hypothetical protein
MNENFDELQARLQSADPARDSSVLNEGLVAQAPLAKPKRLPLSRRIKLTLLSGSSVAAVSALTLAVSLALPQQPLIQMASGGQQGRAEAMLSSDAAAPGMKMIAPMWIEYEYDTTALSEETGRGNVYQLVLDGDPKQKLQQLADFFGVEGEIREEEWSSPEYPTFAIGKPERQVSITWAGTGNFYFNSWDENSYRCENKTITLEDGSSYESCEPIATPELIPSVDAIRAEAFKIFEEFGLGITKDKIRVDRSDWGASAIGAVQIEGQDTALEWWINYDGAGKLSSVAGHFAKPLSRGEFNTVSAKDAAARIKDGRWFGSPASSVWSQYSQGAMGLRTTDAVSAPAVEPAPEATTKESSDTEVDVQPIDVKPEIVTLKLTGSEKQLLMIYDKSGGAWLVPGYLLKNDQGWFDSIISLVEGVIELPEPYVVEPLPATKQD